MTTGPVEQASGPRDHPSDHSRGRQARPPGKIPPKGWKDVLLRVKDEVADDNLSIVAGGVAFYVLLSLFPALAAAVAIYGLVADPAAVSEAIAGLSGVLPPSAFELVEEQLQGIVRSAPSTLGWGAVVSILLALWSASKGSKALIAGVNLAYDEGEDRGFVRVQGLSLLFTLGIVVGAVVSVGLLWLQITFFLILLGAELNAELEHQTAIDSTTGPPEPMGESGAHMADTLGERRGE